MCMEDVTIARETTQAYKTVQVAITATLLVEQNARRYSLIISASKTVDLYLGFDASVSTTNGILIPANTAPLVLDLQHHGSILKGAIQAVSSAGTVPITYMETILERDK